MSLAQDQLPRCVAELGVRGRAPAGDIITQPRRCRVRPVHAANRMQWRDAARWSASRNEHRFGRADIASGRHVGEAAPATNDYCAVREHSYLDFISAPSASLTSDGLSIVVLKRDLQADGGRDGEEQGYGTEQHGAADKGENHYDGMNARYLAEHERAH